MWQELNKMRYVKQLVYNVSNLLAVLEYYLLYKRDTCLLWKFWKTETDKITEKQSHPERSIVDILTYFPPVIS